MLSNNDTLELFIVIIAKSRIPKVISTIKKNNYKKIVYNLTNELCKHYVLKNGCQRDWSLSVQWGSN